MATVSTHTLSGLDGSHAGHIGVVLYRLNGEVRHEVFASETDAGGRLVETIEPGNVDQTATYELVFATGNYWANHPAPRDGAQIMKEVVLRFEMPDPEARYHLPVILSPNGYSVWWSVPEQVKRHG